MSPSTVQNQEIEAFHKQFHGQSFGKQEAHKAPRNIPESKLKGEWDCGCQRLEVELASRQEVPPARTLKEFTSLCVYMCVMNVFCTKPPLYTYIIYIYTHTYIYIYIYREIETDDVNWLIDTQFVYSFISYLHISIHYIESVHMVSAHICSNTKLVQVFLFFLCLSPGHFDSCYLLYFARTTTSTLLNFGAKICPLHFS